jgi:hypothetical protein
MYVKPSTRKEKKLMAHFYDNTTEKRKTVHFGAKGYRDFTTIDDMSEAQATRQRYWTRHKKDLETNNPLSPGYLSLFILWGKHQNVAQNISEYKKRFNL